MRLSIIYYPLLSTALLTALPQFTQAQTPLIIREKSAVQFSAENLPQPQAYQRPTALDTLSTQQSYQPDAQLVALENQLLPTVLNLMKQQQWAQAQQTLAPLLNRTSPSLHGLFLAGQIAEQQQEWQSAVNYYRKMLAIDNSLHRPRLELAKALAKAGDIKASEYQFNLVLSQKLPQTVENNVFSMLRNLKAQTSYLNFQFAFVPSSNINQGSGQRSFVLGGREFVLSDSNRAKRGIGMQIGINGEKRFGSEYQWFVNGSLSHLDFPNRYNDQTTTRVMLGRSFGDSRSHAVDLSVGGHHVLYQHKGLYQGGLARLDYGWRFKPNLKLSLSWESQQLHYRPQFDYLRGWQHWLSARLNYIAQGRTIYQFGIQQGFNQAAEKNYSYRTLTLQTGIRHHFDFQQLTLGGNIAYSHTDYRDITPIFGIKRQDNRWNTSLDILKRNWSWQGFAPRLSFHYINNRSNIPINSYRNKQVRLTFSKEF